MADLKHTYQVELNWTEGRKGLIHSDVLDSKIEVATPPEFPGGVEGIWSPEHLFVASVSSCFMTTFLAIAELSKLEYSDLSVTAKGVMGKPEGKYEITDIELNAELTIPDKSKTEKAARILQKAEENCLITRSVKTRVELISLINIG